MLLKRILMLTLVVLLVAACAPATQPAAEAPAADAPAADAPAAEGEEIIVGLITKTETNPFFVKMKEGAQAKAD